MTDGQKQMYGVSRQFSQEDANALIARRIMRLEACDWEYRSLIAGFPAAVICPTHCPTGVQPAGDGPLPCFDKKHPPDYLGAVPAAWSLVERLIANGWWFGCTYYVPTLEGEARPGRWYVTVSQPERAARCSTCGSRLQLEHTAEASTLALAIGLVALKTVGVELTVFLASPLVLHEVANG